jgi:RNA polymerase sigma factor (sigma-70 family)
MQKPPFRRLTERGFLRSRQKIHSPVSAETKTESEEQGMKIFYRDADGETVEYEVEPAIAGQLAEFERQDANARRKARRRNEASIEHLRTATNWEPTDTSANIEADYEKREEADELARAIERLNEKQRALVRLRYFEGVPLVDIARRLGVSKPAITQQFGTIHKNLGKFVTVK